MRITNTKQNNSFQNITRIKSLTNPIYQNAQNRIADKASAEVEKVLNGLESSIYSKKEAEVIKNFFSVNISDYNCDKASIVLIKNELYLLTGRDFDEMKQTDDYIEKMTDKIKKALKNSLSLKAVFTIKNARCVRDKEIIKRGERNPEFFKFLSSEPIEKITYDQTAGLEPIDVKLNIFQHFKPGNDK